jgi:3-oxoacyl-(acyl-carrier-protein) synthase
MGPNYSISTACATANYAFVAAANHIRKGDCDVVVVGASRVVEVECSYTIYVHDRSANKHQHALM